MAQDVSHREVHAVAVVVREGDRVLVEHSDEPGVPALVRAGGGTAFVAGGEEEHVPRLDEGAVALADRGGDQPLVDAVGQAPGVEAVLELAIALVKQLIHVKRVRPGPVTVTRWTTKTYSTWPWTWPGEPGASCWMSHPIGRTTWPPSPAVPTWSRPWTVRRKR